MFKHAYRGPRERIPSMAIRGVATIVAAREVRPSQRPARTLAIMAIGYRLTETMHMIKHEEAATERPKVVITSFMPAMVEAATEALGRLTSPRLFSREGVLVELKHVEHRQFGRSVKSLVAEPITLTRLREILSLAARWLAPGGVEPKEVLPPQWIAK
ncbi:MAG TPA: hypothetical protein VHF22_10955, partial [Planctomycetota bacterium]|nr:hypothetical protein [Planctomycetota bacterium]